MNTGQIVTLVVSVIFSGGLVGGVVALLKLRPESGQIVVTAAQGAVVVQSGVIDDLRQELQNLRAERDALRAENVQLRTRVAALEQKFEALRAEVHEER